MNEPIPTESGITPLAPPETPIAAPDSARQYEFDDAQNDTINHLAMAMLWVRFPLLIAAVLEGLIAIGLAFRIHRDGAHIVGALGHALVAIVCFMLANWLVKAASAFLRVTTTTGRDISHLMTGLTNLSSWFELLAFFVKLYLILIAILAVLLIVGHMTGAFRGAV
jgi:hypothetical protein